MRMCGNGLQGRQKEIVGSVGCGLLCQPEDVEALAGALQRVMTDDGLRHRLQENAIVRSRYFLPTNIVERWDRLLADVVASRK